MFENSRLVGDLGRIDTSPKYPVVGGDQVNQLDTMVGGARGPAHVDITCRSR